MKLTTSEETPDERTSSTVTLPGICDAIASMLGELRVRRASDRKARAAQALTEHRDDSELL